MSTKQQRRAEILSRTAACKLSTSEASQLLGVSARHVRRLLHRYETMGLASIPHGNTARSPANKTDPEQWASIQALAGPEGPYHDFNVSHMRVMLAKNEQIQIGRSTLDRLLREQSVRPPKRKLKRRIFKHRERRPREGDLLQIDGSLHDWLEGRAAKMCLMGAIDDATGKILHLRFWPTETLNGYLTLFQDVACAHGLPVSFYHDKHTILRSPKEATIEDELAGRTPMSQAQKVLERLGVESISANSPQAKGRIERLWRTLQDRLIKEMRLENVASLEEANNFLPSFIQSFNATFAVVAADPETSWVAMPKGADLSYYFSQKKSRVVRLDHTLSWLGRTLQIVRRRGDASLARKHINVHIDPQGALYLYDGKTRLEYKELPATSAAKRSIQQPSVSPVAQAKQPKGKPSDNAGRRAWLYANG